MHVYVGEFVFRNFIYLTFNKTGTYNTAIVKYLRIECIFL